MSRLAQRAMLDIAILLKSMHINQTELARRLGVSRAHVSQLFLRRRDHKIQTVERLAHAIDLELVITFQPRRKPPRR